jgi:dual specificity tyrosine-phosphorylation-regulated kinase 2/3/4
MQLALN